MQILIWGDYMKRQISICVFLSIVLLILAILFVAINNQEKSPYKKINETETQVKSYTSDQVVEQTLQPKEYKYYAIEKEGRLSVYENVKETLFMDTAIEIRLLPEDIRKKIERGIYFENEAELYDFLESYSS